jgi:hypothetical protein
MREERREGRERTLSRPISELLSKTSQIMDLWYDDLWSYKKCRVSCSEAKRVWGLTEVFLSLEKPQEVLATRVSENVEDGIEGKTNLRWSRS